MAKNIEIKARCRDLKQTYAAARELATDYPGTDHQTDTYFTTRTGRFKLRESSLSGSYLVPYLRADESGPRESFYLKIAVEEPQKVKDIFGRLLGVHTVVEKKREIFLYHNVRIHLDEVKGLGSFVELEAVLNVDSDIVKEKNKVHELMDRLGISQKDLITVSYENMISERS